MSILNLNNYINSGVCYVWLMQPSLETKILIPCGVVCHKQMSCIVYVIITKRLKYVS